MGIRDDSFEQDRLPNRGTDASRPRQLSNADSVFVSVDSAATPSIIAGLTIVDAAGSPGFDFERYRSILRDRIVLVDRFRFKLMEIPFGLDNGYWVEAEDFDPVDHVHRIALPAPGDRAALCELVGLLHGWPLDPSRPLWECWWIEGLEGGRVATLLKFHHCLMDGQSSMGLSEVLLDLSPEPRPTDEDAPDLHEPPPRPPSLVEMARSALKNAARRPERIAVHAGRALYEGLAWLRDRPEAERAPSVPPTHFNDRLSGQRSFAYTSIPLAPIRDAKKHFGVKVNDVLLELLASSLRRVLIAEGRLPSESIVALCPVSLRNDEDRSLGNQLASIPVTLGTHRHDPVDRLLEIHRSSKASKLRLDEGAFEAMAALSECFVPGALRLLTRAAHTVPSLLPLPGNLIFSNVRGLNVPLYLAGARVEEIYPISMLQVANGMNVTAVTHDDQVDFGFLVDAALVPDPWRYADAIQHALAELEHAVSGRNVVERPVAPPAPPKEAQASAASAPPGKDAVVEPLDLMIIMSGLSRVAAPSREPIKRQVASSPVVGAR